MSLHSTTCARCMAWRQHRAVVPGQPGHHGRRHAGLDRSASGPGQLEIHMKHTCSCRRHGRIALACGPRRQLLGFAALAGPGHSAPWWAAATLREPRRPRAPSISTAPPVASSTACCWPTTPAPRPVHYAGQERPSFFCDMVELFNTLLWPESRCVRCAPSMQDMGKADWEHPGPLDRWQDRVLRAGEAMAPGLHGPDHRQFRARGRRDKICRRIWR